jgi:lactobin A/cerein 7B family class IIb bacteriocin
VLRLGIRTPGKGRENEKNKQMEKFKELSIEEMQEVEGGLGFWATVGAGIIVGLTVATFVAVIEDWDNFKAGLNGEPEIPRD